MMASHDYVAEFIEIIFMWYWVLVLGQYRVSFNIFLIYNKKV